MTLRGYQKKAISSLRTNDWKGILEMATGTGKTWTSIYASIEYYVDNGSIFRIILVPFLHLISQWRDELKLLGVDNIIECSGNNINWEVLLTQEIRNYQLGLTDEVTIISSYASSKSKRFENLISRIDKNMFLIADECHYFGTKGIDASVYAKSEGRIGLSATPNRWWDEVGTKKIMSFFGETVFKYSIKEAIFNDFLTEYRYYPLVVDLTYDELEEFNRLTRRISILIDNDKLETEEFLMVTLKRKRILSNAYYKIKKLEVLMDKFKLKKDTLIYCSPQNINEVTMLINNLGYKVRIFNHEVSYNERERILNSFENGEIEVLTAIKCLDEGVDIPSVKNAIFLSSTSNPREFIQRRGRVLRKHKNKAMANIFDFIVLPSMSGENIFLSIAKMEMPRFAEFANSAINGSAAREKIMPILDAYNLEYLMHMSPWEIYEEEKERWDNEL